MDGRKHIELRIKESTENDAIMGVFFNSTLSHLERQIGTVAVVTVQREILGGEGIVAFFRYPVRDLLRILGRALDFQRGPNNEVAFLHGLGRAAVRGILNTPLAQAVGMLGKGKPNALLASAPTAFMTLATYGERRHVEKDPGSATMSYKRDLLGPAFSAGLAEQALESLGQVRATASATALNASSSDFTLELSW